MSARPAIVQAQEHSQFAGTRLHVLLAIAAHAYPDGRESYPGMARIARLARVSERTCQRSIDVLTEAGELRVYRKAGPYGTNLYELTDKVLDSGHEGASPPDTQMTGRRDAQVSGDGDAQVPGHDDIWPSGSEVRETPPRHSAEPPRHSSDVGNPTDRDVAPDTQASPKPSLAIQKAVPKPSPRMAATRRGQLSRSKPTRSLAATVSTPRRFLGRMGG